MAAEAEQRRLDVILPQINRLLSSRDFPKTICPSEVARAISATDLDYLGVSEWRDLMPEIREILWTMRERGEVEILQRGACLPEGTELQNIRGPIRARKTQQS